MWLVVQLCLLHFGVYAVTALFVTPDEHNLENRGYHIISRMLNAIIFKLLVYMHPLELYT